MQPVVGDLPPQSEYLQDPNARANDNHHVQKGLDPGGHRDEAIDQPQHYADYDQRNDNAY
jgi:hypothetical protein